jgi:2-dehydropantoate 2-reductase
MKKVAVIGLGAIGGLVVAYLRQKGIPVVAVGRPEQKKQIERHGLSIEGVRGKSLIYVDVKDRLEEKVDLAILAVKTQDLKDAVSSSGDFLASAPVVLSTQNGVRADKLLSIMLGPGALVSSIVMFGATYVPPHTVVHNFEGSWLIGRPDGANDGKVAQVVDFLKVAFKAEAVEGIGAMKWTKVFVNAANAVPALVGKSLQETYADLGMCRLTLSLLREGFGVVDKLGIVPADMPDFEVAKLKGLTQMPVDEAAPIYSKIMTGLSAAPVYGSILQSLQRGRPSEIDYINGEFANQARLNNIDARLNARATELIHRIEATKVHLTPEQALEEMAR